MQCYHVFALKNQMSNKQNNYFLKVKLFGFTIWFTDREEPDPDPDSAVAGYPARAGYKWYIPNFFVSVQLSSMRDVAVVHHYTVISVICITLSEDSEFCTCQYH